MKGEYYNLYYIFQREKDECIPCEARKIKVLKKVLEIFEEFKTKGAFKYSYSHKPKKKEVKHENRKSN